MKKIIWIAAAGLLAIPANSQDKNGWGTEKSYLAVSAGVAVPILCYGSKNTGNPNAGFAKPGFSIDLSYAYRFNNTIGVAGSVFYAFNNAGSSAVKAVSSPGSYRLIGLLAGPVLSRNFSDRWAGDIKFLAGVSRSMTPELQYGDGTLLNDHSVNAFTWGGGIALRYKLSGNTFLQLKTDHVNLKPKFRMQAGETGKNEQHIVLMNVDAGVGWKF